MQLNDLFVSRRFLPLFIAQFFGAFNDNLLKNALIILITYYLVTDGANPQLLVTLAAGLFIVPFLLFSALAGQIADKYDRAKLAVLIKLFEILIMLLAAIGFINHNSWFLIAVLFASGLHSTFFGPIKYALLPQHLKSNELLLGNAYVEAGTFLAILLGTICGGLLILTTYGTYAVAAGLIIFAMIGYVASRYIPPSPGPDPNLQVNYNLITETATVIKHSKTNNTVFYSIIGISWFWFIGATFLTQFPNLVKNYLHTQAQIVTIFLTIFSLGMGLGALICSKLLQGALKSIYVSVAIVVMSIFIVDLCFACQNIVYFNLPALLSTERFLNLFPSWRIMLDLLAIAICGGIYIVPLYTIMQYSANKNYLARIIAANNILNAVFMVASALLIMLMLKLNRNIYELFLLIAILNILMAYYIAVRLKISRKTNDDL